MATLPTTLRDPGASAVAADYGEAMGEAASLAREAWPLLRAELRRLVVKDANGHAIGVTDPALVLALARCSSQAVTQAAGLLAILRAPANLTPMVVLPERGREEEGEVVVLPGAMAVGECDGV